MLQGISYVANMPSVESDLEDLTSWLRQSDFSNQWNTRTSSDLRQIIDRTCASNVIITQEHVKLCADAFRLGESIVGHLNGSESAKTISMSEDVRRRIDNSIKRKGYDERHNVH